jgi:UTP--glucose-1-phosphate uridylyltransferase
VVQHVVDEAGIEHFIFITGRDKGIIEDHFELEHTSPSAGATPISGGLARNQPGPGTASFTCQQLPLGLGNAVWCAR